MPPLHSPHSPTKMSHVQELFKNKFYYLHLDQTSVATHKNVPPQGYISCVVLTNIAIDNIYFNLYLNGQRNHHEYSIPPDEFFPALVIDDDHKEQKALFDKFAHLFSRRIVKKSSRMFYPFFHFNQFF